MARHNYSVTTLQARTMKKAVEMMEVTANNVSLTALHEAQKLIEMFPDIFKTAEINAYIAFIASEIMKKLYSENKISLSDFIASYAEHKMNMYSNSKDFGAFGDLFELLIRIIIIGNLNLIRATALSVAAFGKNDIISKKYGKIEVGHNGKTFTQGTCFDYMDGDYQTMIYGMFSEIDRQLIYGLCIEGNVKQAMDEIKKRTAIWTDKHQFQADMNALGKGGKTIKAITLKGGNIQIQNTDSMYYNFIDRIEDGTFTRLP